MRRNFPLFAVAILFFALSAPVASGQNLAWFQDRLVSYLEKPRVLAMGRSKDGKWADISPIDTGGRGGMAVRLISMDAIEDTILFDKSIWSDEVEQIREGTVSLAEAMTGSQTWRDFITLCGRLRIARPGVGEEELQPFPFQSQGALIGVRTDITVDAEVGEYGSKSISYRLVAESSAKGEKTITSGKVADAYEIVADGYSLSPFEPRMVVAFSIFRAGFEGDRVRMNGFSGCKLDTGFKKK